MNTDRAISGSFLSVHFWGKHIDFGKLCGYLNHCNQETRSSFAVWLSKYCHAVAGKGFALRDLQRQTFSLH